MANPEKPEAQTNWPKTFKDWAAERTDLSPIEQVNEFSAEFNLIPEERTNLLKGLGIEEPGPGKPIPPRPRGEVFKAFLDYANKNPGLQLGQAVGYFAYAFKLTPVERMALNEDVAKLRQQREEEKRREEEKKRREEEERKRREEEERKRREEEEKRRKEEEKKKQPTEKPDLIIGRTPYPKWWKDQRAWGIDIPDAGTHTIIRQTPGWRTYIATIVLTVDGETNITFGLGVFGSSGAMDFGGTDEPRGMVIANGESPIPCGEGGFTITSDGVGVHVGGFITYYYEKE